MCKAPPDHPDWEKMSSDKAPWLLGMSVSYTCKHDSQVIAAMTCEHSGDGRYGDWSALSANQCKKKSSVTPIGWCSL